MSTGPPCRCEHGEQWEALFAGGWPAFVHADPVAASCLPHVRSTFSHLEVALALGDDERRQPAAVRLLTPVLRLHKYPLVHARRRREFARPSTDALDRAFQALSDANRRAILATVEAEPRAVGELADLLSLSQQATSHHLKVLRGADLVTSSRDGTRQLYAVRTDGLATPRAYLDDLWPDRLQALKRAAEADSGDAAREDGRDG